MASSGAPSPAIDPDRKDRQDRPAWNAPSRNTLANPKSWSGLPVPHHRRKELDHDGFAALRRPPVQRAAHGRRKAARSGSASKCGRAPLSQPGSFSPARANARPNLKFTANRETPPAPRLLLCKNTPGVRPQAEGAEPLSPTDACVPGPCHPLGPGHAWESNNRHNAPAVDTPSTQIRPDGRSRGLPGTGKRNRHPRDHDQTSRKRLSSSSKSRRVSLTDPALMSRVSTRPSA